MAARRKPQRTNTRDAGTGRFVPASEAKKRPKETVTERVSRKRKKR